jgi:hypothetical protein
MPNLFLHIGTHKTGTTSIQHALRQFSERAPIGEALQYIVTPPLEIRRIMLSQQYDENLVASISSHIQQEVLRTSDSYNFVISNEAFSGRGTDGYLNSNAVAEMLREATINFDTKVVIYLRRQDDMVESMYAQQIHEGGSLGFEEYLSQLDPGLSFDYGRILQDWVRCFTTQNLIVRSYQQANAKGLIEDFSEAIETPALRHTRPERKNPSYSHNAIRIARIANEMLDPASRRKLRRGLQEAMPKRAADYHSLFSHEDRIAFLSLYRESNQHVAETFFGEELEDIFPQDNLGSTTADTGNRLDQITPEEIAKLIFSLLSENELTHQPTGLVAGAKVAISGYPRVKRVLRRLFGR